jgi:signal transduction histidine kinase
MNSAESVGTASVHRDLDLTVGQRLAIGFGLLLLTILAFSVAVSVWHAESTDAQRDYSEEIAPLTHRADRLERATLYLGIGLRSYLLVPDAQRLATYRSYAERTRRAVEDLGAAGNLPRGAPELREIREHTLTYVEGTDRLAEMRSKGPIPPDEEALVVTLRERSLASVHRLIDLQEAATTQALSRISSAQSKMTNGMVTLFVIGSVLCLAIAWFTTQSVRRPTHALVRVAGAMERGDWQPALHLAPSADDARSARSEMRRLARAIGTAAAALEQRERDLRERNDKIAAQNAELHRWSSQVREQNEQLQIQNQEIQSQSEELQSQSEELQSQSEELHSQNEELTQQGIELRARSEALAAANERTNHFLGVLAHELRNPLAPISNSIFILKRVDPTSEHALKAQAVIERQTRHMIRLIDDLLDVTRISQGKIRVQKEPFDMTDAVRNCLEDQSITLEQGGLQLALDLPARPIHVRGDYTRVCQVFGNLLSNAIKFTNRGGTVAVSLREDEAAQEAILQVTDTGIGLDPELLPQLFQPFSQGANAYTHTNGGLGLGLALVKALVELHDGSVVANSAGPNRGSQFVVRLPLATKTPEPDAVAR